VAFTAKESRVIPCHEMGGDNRNALRPSDSLSVCPSQEKCKGQGIHACICAITYELKLRQGI